MPGYTIKKLDGEPILLVTYLDTWETHRDLPAASSQVMQTLDTLDEPVFYIIDMTQEPPFNLQDLISVSGLLTKGMNAILHHPNMREHLVITQNNAIKLATKGLGSQAFGNVPARAFDTLDEALAYAHSK